TVLEDYINSGLTPEIVSIGNETNIRFCEPNVSPENLPPYEVVRTVKLLNAGTKAVRDLNKKYNLNIKIACHIFSVGFLKTWMKIHIRNGLDFDVMALSHYHQLHSLGDFDNWKQVVAFVRNTYKKDFIILETAQIFTDGFKDNARNILGKNNIPTTYNKKDVTYDMNPPTTNTQRKYLSDMGKDLYISGGLGVIYWGGEWVGSNNTLVYPLNVNGNPGSTWENAAFWDFNYNLHDGINWMKDIVP
ncbi:MAG TPA: hypothetical protein DDZ41_01465, partial [Flavobacterium sp.]|nr:hypothetical protein [Flavobacterium sp.]